jgi:hypothetical protein
MRLLLKKRQGYHGTAPVSSPWRTTSHIIAPSVRETLGQFELLCIEVHYDTLSF